MQEHFFMMCLSQLLLIPSRTQVGRCSVLLLYQCLLSNIHSFSVEWRRRVSWWWWFNCTMLCSRTVLAVSVQCFWGAEIHYGPWWLIISSTRGNYHLLSIKAITASHHVTRKLYALLINAHLGRIYLFHWVPYKLNSSSISSLAMHVVERFVVSKS